MHLYLLLSVIEHLPPFLQGDDAQRLDLSQFRPVCKILLGIFCIMYWSIKYMNHKQT